MPRVFLFDIDNTLLYSGGAGGVAMAMAFEQLFGVPDGFGKIEFSGRTDRFLLKSALDTHGIDGDFAVQMEAFVERYYAILPGTLAEKQGALMPGFPALLETLAGSDNVRLGLATGNFSEAARYKLAHYGIDRYFDGDEGLMGGFGELSLDRSDIVRAAIEALGRGAVPGDILVIGDTPKDVVAALDNGVAAVGVATGSYSAAELRDSGAHIVFEDFSDWRGAAEAMLGYGS